ncbi:MAG: hypothetical protein AAFN43_01485 [Pseudomonadota bacterium]
MNETLFIPEADQVHPSWYHAWGEHVGTPEIGQILFQNQRLKQRVHEQMIRSSEIEIETRFDRDTLNALVAYATTRDQLMRLCGMVIHGKLLRENVSRLQFDQLAKSLPMEDMRIAVALRDFHIEDGERAVDLPRIKQLVERSGTACVALWKAALPRQSQLRLELLDEVGFELPEGNPEFGPDIASTIVVEVSRALAREKALLAA